MSKCGNMNSVILILIVLLFPTIYLVSKFIADRRVAVREQKAYEDLVVSGSDYDRPLADILFVCYKEIKDAKPGGEFVSDANYIYWKARRAQTDRAVAILWLEQMRQRMNAEYQPRCIKRVTKCNEDIKKLDE